MFSGGSGSAIRSPNRGVLPRGLAQPGSALILLSLATLLAPHADASGAPPTSSATIPETRYLVVALCGVGYSLVEEMFARGELPHFRPPSALVVSFPSLTSPALVEILKPLGAPPIRGYEDYYFDPQKNRMRGGFFHRFRRKDFVTGSFREVFDYHPHPVLMTMEYSLPALGAWLGGRITWGRIVKKFERSEKTHYLAYLDATDPQAHVGGKRFVRGLLKRIDREIPRLQRRAHGPVEVIVFSDHGNAFRRYRRASLVPALKRSGFRPRKKLDSPRSVVFPQYGLVGSAVFYTQPGVEPEVAEVLRSVEGVGVLAYRDAATLVVDSAAGQARLLRREQSYCYQPDTGDPLELAETLQQLKAAGKITPDGCADSDTWWQATQEHTYPDPLRRLWAAFGCAGRPASVIVSLQDGYYAGSKLLDFFAGLRATHGNLGREQSLGFVLTTAEPLPPYIRGDQLWDVLQEQARLRVLPRPWQPLPDTVLMPAARQPAAGETATGEESKPKLTLPESSLFGRAAPGPLFPLQWNPA